MIRLGTVIALAAAGGCQSASRSGPSDNPAGVSSGISGDVARNAVLARTETERAYDLIRRGKDVEAEPVLKRAIAADPSYGPAHNDLGLIYFQRGELYGAAWEFENAIKLMPTQAAPQNNLGLVLEKGGKLQEAAKTYGRACELETENSEFAGNYARVRIRLGLRDEATTRLLELVVMRDNRPEWVEWARFNLSRAKPSLPEGPSTAPSTRVP